MALRQFDFVVGPETPTLPSVSSPTDPDDLVTLSYADANYEPIRPTGTASISDNISSATNVVGLTLSNTTELAAVVHYRIMRRTDSNSYAETGAFHAAYNTETSSWVGESVAIGGEDGGVTLSITSAGQVQYISDGKPGTNYSGSIHWQINRWGV